VLGRHAGYLDHQMIDSLVDLRKKSDYRMQSRLLAIVASEVFQTK
jgi:hypothetical protein